VPRITARLRHEQDDQVPARMFANRRIESDIQRSRSKDLQEKMKMAIRR